MEHEVFVPVPSDRLAAALADPARVARAVPGLQQEAGAEPVAGRLKMRIGSHSITYRGTLRIAAQDDGSYAVEGDAAETRGTGSVKLALTVRLRDTDGGTTLTVQGTASADGRITELPEETVHSAVTRLLGRTAENLAADAGREPQETAPAASPSVFDTEVPPPSLDPTTDEPDLIDDRPEEPPAAQDATEPPAAQDATEPPVAQGAQQSPVARDFAESAEPPAEAAHARRTMIGRSAEEVDHAPPRGRYAPVPAPQTVAQNPTLRWAPAAALVVATAIVVGRALRRRH
ncbi:SRPBCC family protein [Streptomyces spinoverrucosus]|uniref:SRPBCC domain-containing protein n=1 Tax=Streptomyces spinoverrucosus TaxID=284043 RepID=UPI0018C3F3DC|nr:SRPBCC domain-containing protein [Streptomyces spinoverrucosus]MBG0853629.1 SRPBCC family protein [Streptomyces spinoverrucosus]